MLFPEALAKLTASSEFKASGGWMLGAAKGIIRHEDVDLYIATVSPLVTDFTIIEGEYITYFIRPQSKFKKTDSNNDQFGWSYINSYVKPDVVHIHGTEYEHGYNFMQSCGVDNVVVSIQGLVSACGNYYHKGMSNLDIFLNLTLRDIIKGGVWRQKQTFINSGKQEVRMLRLAQNVIGRTSWDKERMWAINPTAQYFFCNETLRDEFYDGSLWDYSKCKKHTIFLSQASYPIKGLHQLLKAMPLILKHYPDTTIRIAGNDIISRRRFIDYIRYTGYGKYLNKLIKQFKLTDKITFTGCLNADEMKEEYLAANVFVCPSSIENSPNSLGEAQILGVPCVASYVGGVPDMMLGCEDKLYRYEEVEMLAYKICQVFENQKTPDIGVVNSAMKRHDPSINSDVLYGIYNNIIKR